MRIRAYLIKVLLYLIALAILYLPVALMAEQVCLTKREAHKLWPRQHLYWYGPNHCWSNRRGPPRGIKVDPINQVMAQAEPEPQTVTVENKSDPWGPAEPLRVVLLEIAPPVMSAPVTPVEVASDMPLLTAPPSLFLRLAAWSGGAFSAFLIAFLFVFNGKVLIYVKRSAAWIHRGISLAREKVAKIGSRSRDIESPLLAIGIGEFIRRADRAGRNAHLAKVADRLENLGDPCDPFEPEDHSAIACWARSLRP